MDWLQYPDPEMAPMGRSLTLIRFPGFGSAFQWVQASALTAFGYAFSTSFERSCTISISIKKQHGPSEGEGCALAPTGDENTHDRAPRACEEAGQPLHGAAAPGLPTRLP